jgi:predicted DNA-binding transcriptional regulator YafY
MAGQYSTRIKRILALVTSVKADPCQPLESLLAQLGISRSQFYKDKDLLASLGFRFHRQNGCFVIDEEAGLPMESFSLSERLALIMAVRQLAASGESFLSYQGLEAARKLISSLDERWREATSALFDDFVLREGFGCDPSILNSLQQACLEQRRLEISYLKPDSRQSSSYIFEPYIIYFQNRSMYVDGYCPTRQDFRTFKAARIQRIKETALHFTRRKGFDFRSRHRGTFTAYAGRAETKVSVRFYPKVRRYIEETLWHHTQTIEEGPERSIIFRAKVAEPREIMWWAFSWGDGAEILEPEWLREEAKETVRSINGLYER